MAFKMKGFEAHNMYKTERAETEAEHNALEKKGYDHNPYKKKSCYKKTAFYKKDTPCWKGYSHKDKNGKPRFKKKGGKMVPDCRPI